MLRIFGSETLFARMMNNSLEDGEAIGGKWLSRAIETAQKKVEARNYDIRKQLVEYDNVMNDQRKVIYEQRSDIMDAEAVDDVLDDMFQETVNTIVADHCPPETYPEQWDVDGLKRDVAEILGLAPDIDSWMQEEAVRRKYKKRLRVELDMLRFQEKGDQLRKFIRVSDPCIFNVHIECPMNHS